MPLNIENKNDFDVFFIYFLKFSEIIPRIWNPIFDKLIRRSKKCAVGYAQIMRILTSETDLSLKTNNGNSLRILFKVFGNLFQKQLPFISNKRLHKNFVQAVEGNRQEEARLAKHNNRIDWCAVNKFFVKAANGLNDIL